VTTLEVPLDAAGARLDAWLAQRMPLSRSRLRALIEEQHVTVAGAGPRLRGSDRLKGGERVVVREPPPAPVELVPQALPLSVVYEDEELLVIDKAAGMAVHPGAGVPDGTVANAVLHRCPQVTIGGELRPGIVHRLDKDTSGLLVVCKTDQAMQEMARAFAERRVDKRYTAMCLGRPRQERFELVTGHRRADSDRRRFTTRIPPPVAEGGAVRLAHSRFRLLVSAEGASVLEVELLTGRTHQIRAHLADIGHPLLQDALYGGGHAEKRLRPSPVREAVRGLRRQALHASSLAFRHPTRGAPFQLAAPLPADLAAVEAAIRGAGGPE
jgi:23S rRNA pseudouridine1911/1915/1917 synthase